MKNSSRIFVLLVLIHLSCTKKIDLKIKDKEDVPVLNFIISNNYDNSNSIFAVLTKSNFILNADRKFDSIGGAQFKFYEESIEFGEISNGQFPKGQYYLSKSFELKPNTKYQVTGNVPGFEPISAETYIPAITNFSISDFVQDSILFDFKVNITDDDPEFNYYLFNMTFTLKNPLDTNQIVAFTNFYIPNEIIALRDKSSSSDFLQLISDGINADFIISEADLKNFNNQFSFSNANFSYFESGIGGVFTSKTEFQNFRVYKLSKELYQYIRSSQKQQQIGDNPFSEPVFVYTNVKNGLGIFAGYSVTTYK